MTPYIEFVLFVLLPCFLATLLNRFALKDSIGNLRIVAYKLFRIAAIFAIASQIQFRGDLSSFAGGYYAMKFIGYTFMFALVFDLFLIYPKKTPPSALLSISNIVLWIVGIIFFTNILDHYADVTTNKSGDDGLNMWNGEGSFYGLSPFYNVKLLWKHRVLPKTDDVRFEQKLADDKMLFNMFSSVKSAKNTPKG